MCCETKTTNELPLRSERAQGVAHSLDLSGSHPVENHFASKRTFNAHGYYSKDPNNRTPPLTFRIPLPDPTPY